jgi:hypothetical protein
MIIIMVLIQIGTVQENQGTSPVVDFRNIFAQQRTHAPPSCDPTQTIITGAHRCIGGGRAGRTQPAAAADCQAARVRVLVSPPTSYLNPRPSNAHQSITNDCRRSRSQGKPAPQQQPQQQAHQRGQRPSAPALLLGLSPEQLVEAALEQAAAARHLQGALLHNHGTQELPSTQQQQQLVLQCLEQLAAAAHARLAELSRQQLADLAWAAAHHSQALARPLHAAMAVPFQVLPCALPGLRLEVSGGQGAQQRRPAAAPATHALPPANTNAHALPPSTPLAPADQPSPSQHESPQPLRRPPVPCRTSCPRWRCKGTSSFWTAARAPCRRPA